MADTDRSIAAVLSDIVGDLQQIIRAEVRLAKVEVREELGKAKQGAAMLVTAGIVLILSVGLALLAAVYALALVWPSWAAALVVALAVGATGGLLAMTGLHRLSDVKLAPPKTVSTVRENIQWAKTRTR
ncbi:MAG TPA: phage holin family protein [Vicinamibacterales bacterium]|nr:phage holin family protein [Vicinamibacterales bacterium]